MVSVFRGVRGAARRSYSIFEVPSRGLIILLSGLGSHTSASHLHVQNFNPILFPARLLFWVRFACWFLFCCVCCVGCFGFVAFVAFLVVVRRSSENA